MTWRFRSAHSAASTKARGSLWAGVIALLVFLCPGSAWGAPDSVAVIISGLGGVPEYEENFQSWSEQLEKIFREGSSQVHRLDGREVRRDEVLSVFEQVKTSAESEIWVFLVGHANVNREQYKFNIKGPDLTDADLAGFLDGLGERRVFLVAATSSSGLLATRLAAENRVVVTATRTPRERFPPMFLSFFLEAVESPQADRDKNGKVSLLEAYQFSENKVTEWFQEQGRIQTEHALLADRGRVRLGEKAEEKGEGEVHEAVPVSGAGMLAAIAYLSSPPEQAYRSLEAQELVGERKVVERRIEELKFRKKEMTEEEYYIKLQELLVELATLNQRISELEGSQ